MNVQDMCNRNILVLFGRGRKHLECLPIVQNLGNHMFCYDVNFEFTEWVLKQKKNNNMSCHINCKCCIYYHPVSSKLTTWQLYTPQFCIK